MLKCTISAVLLITPSLADFPHRVRLNSDDGMQNIPFNTNEPGHHLHTEAQGRILKEWSMKIWMSFLFTTAPYNLPTPPLHPPSSARSLSLSHGTKAHLAQPCGLNWIRYTRLFRHCAVAWESPRHPHQCRRKERQRLTLVGRSESLEILRAGGGCCQPRIASLPWCPGSAPTPEQDSLGGATSFNPKLWQIPGI